MTAVNNTSCAGTRFGSNLNCTSNDFSSNLTFDQPAASALASCKAGQVVTIDLQAAITSGSAERYDGAYFFSETFSSPSLNDATKSCSVGLFPTAPDPPFFQQPVTLPNVNSCGDYRSSQSSVLRINGVRVKCTPTPGTNTLALPYTLVFSNSNSNNCNVSTVTAGTTAKCLSSTTATVTGIVVNSYVRITKQTAPDGSTQPFNFTASTTSPTGITPSAFTLTDGATQDVEVPFSVSGASHTVTITEAAAGGWYPNASISCTTPTGGSASSYVTVNNATRTIVATLSTANPGAECTITNTKIPTFKLQKKTVGGTGTFSFSSSNLATTPAAITTTVQNTSTPSPLAAVTAHNATGVNSAITISETPVAGYRATSATCADVQSAITGNTGTSFYSLPTASPATPFPTLTIDSTAVKGGAEFNCEITNSKVPQVRIRKVTIGNSAAAGPFLFAASTNLVSTPSLATSGSGAANGVTSSPIEVTSIGSAVVVTESAFAGYALASATCSDGNSAVSGNPAGTIGSLSGNSYTIPAANVVPGADFTCTFTNSRTPTVRVQKVTSTGTGTFSFTATNLASAISNITTTDSAPTPASPAAISVTAPGAAVTITEAATAGFSIVGAYCTDANAAVTGNTGTIGTLSGSVLTIAAAHVVAGADLTCVFTNTSKPQLRIVKISNSGTGSFTFTGAAPNGNGYGSDTITTLSAGGAGQPGTLKILTNAGTVTTISEIVPPGWVFSGVTCTGMGPGGSLSVNGSTFSLDAAATSAGAVITCTVSNDAAVPALSLIKSASTAGPVQAGNVIVYSYEVANTGNVAISGIRVTDLANAYGSAPAPGNETLLLDTAPIGDSTDSGIDGTWATLAPGDKVRFTWSYTVVQDDIDRLQ